MTRPIALILLALALAGCKGDKPTGPHGDVTGIYVVRTVNGAALPALANGSGMTDFTMIADTIFVFEDGFGSEILVTSRPGVSGVQRQVQPFQLSYDDPGYVAFHVNYPCADQLSASLASCIAPPHHRGMRESNGVTFNYSVMYRVPLVFELVGPIRSE